jgi:hypothetical protein
LDIKVELLRVLDNPASVWEAVLGNLAKEPQLALMVLTTCGTPISLVSWQEAVARLGPEAAVRFEASLRVLDDSFVSTARGRGRSIVARFRNPSMDDFCASYLDRNVGFAISVASREPALHQVSRLVDLGSAWAVGSSWQDSSRSRRYGSIYEALIAEPSVLLLRLIDLLSTGSEMAGDDLEPARLMIELLAESSSVPENVYSIVRSRLAPMFVRLGFDSGADQFLYHLLDDSSTAHTLHALLGASFEQFYDSLCQSASEAAAYDSLMNLDLAIGRSPSEVGWAESLAQLGAQWLENATEIWELRSDRDVYDKATAFIGLDAYDLLRGWDEKVESLEREEEVQRERAADEDSETWDADEQSSDSNKDAEEAREDQEIDAMFYSLTNARANHEES